MKILEAFRRGVEMAGRSKRYILLVYGVNFLFALILASAVGMAIAGSVGHSLAGENLLQGFDGTWFRSFSADAQGLAATFNPGVVGIGAVFSGLDAMLRGGLLANHPLITGMGVLYLLMWTLFSAGFIALYAQQDQKGEPAFLKHAAQFFSRFLALAVMAGILYYLIFRFVFGGLSKFVDELTRETIDERVHFFYTLLKYVVVWLLVLTVNVLFDYSKIFTVLRDHRNALTAPLHAARVVFGHIIRTYGLYFSIGVVWVVLMLVYWLIAPGAGQASWITIFGAFVLGQLYLLSRIWVRCLFFAGQTEMGRALLPDSGKTE